MERSERDIVVVGGSAGAIEALTALVRTLPADLPAAVFVVIHTPATAVSHLPEILSRAGPLPARHAREGEAIQTGRIYVAPPDQHLLVRPGVIELTRGPRENHSRPAIDPLFRSAARAYGLHTIGVLRSGALYDGAAGLLAVKGRGGLVMIQDPNEAVVASMPLNALELVEADHILPAARIGSEIARLAQQPALPKGAATMIDDGERISRVIRQDFGEQMANERADEPSMYTCPDCGGMLWQTDPASGGRFRCHVGHVYAPEALLDQQSEEVENALWTCVRLLRERTALHRQRATKSRARGQDELAVRFEEQAVLSERHAEIIRELLERPPASTPERSTAAS